MAFVGSWLLAPRFAGLARTRTSGLGSVRAASVSRSAVRMLASSSGSTDVAQFVGDAIDADKVVVFSTTTCPYCARVKYLFDELDVPFKAYDMDTMDGGVDIRDELLRRTGQRTVPNVFIGKKHLGGCDDAFDAYYNGQLEKMLKDE